MEQVQILPGTWEPYLMTPYWHRHETHQLLGYSSHQLPDLTPKVEAVISPSNPQSIATSCLEVLGSWAWVDERFVPIKSPLNSPWHSQRRTGTIAIILCSPTPRPDTVEHYPDPLCALDQTSSRGLAIAAWGWDQEAWDDWGGEWLAENLLKEDSSR